MRDRHRAARPFAARRRRDEEAQTASVGERGEAGIWRHPESVEVALPVRSWGSARPWFPSTPSAKQVLRPFGPSASSGQAPSAGQTWLRPRLKSSRRPAADPLGSTPGNDLRFLVGTTPHGCPSTRAKTADSVGATPRGCPLSTRHARRSYPIPPAVWRPGPTTGLSSCGPTVTERKKAWRSA